MKAWKSHVDFWVFFAKIYLWNPFNKFNFMTNLKGLLRKNERVAGWNLCILGVDWDLSIYLMFLSQKIDVKLGQNYTKTYKCKILCKIRSIKQIIFNKYPTNLKTTISKKSWSLSSFLSFFFYLSIFLCIFLYFISSFFLYFFLSIFLSFHHFLENYCNQISNLES